MAEQRQIYECRECGDIVEVIRAGVGELVCCNQPMGLLTEKSGDMGQEKHVPVTEKTETGVKVKIGSVPHPMEEGHYIEWIEITTPDGKSCRKFLNPGEAPEAEFCIKAENIRAREHCNVHGLWKSG